MAQCYNVPLGSESLALDMGLTPVKDRPGKFVETFMGTTALNNHQQMDLRAAELAAKIEGATVEHRTKIGRNTSCPCGSGLKFKKCCIGKARYSG